MRYCECGSALWEKKFNLIAEDWDKIPMISIKVLRAFVNTGVNYTNVSRPDTRLPKSRAGGQGPYLRSPDYFGRSSEVKEIKS